MSDNSVNVDLSPKKTIRILLPILFTVPLGGIGVDLYAASMPSLANDLSVSQSQIKLTLTLFLIGLFFGMLLCGFLSDIFGRKKTQVINSIIFSLSSFLIVHTHDFSILLLLRFMQGVSAGGLQSVSRSIISDAFNKKEITKYSLYVTSAWGIGPIIAPWLGGSLMYYFDWHACFYFLFFYGVFIYLLSAFLLPETNCSSLVFNSKEIRKSCIEIFSSKHFFLPVIIMGLSYLTLVCFGILGPYFFVETLNLSPLTYGNIGLIIGFGYLLGNFSCKFLLNKTDEYIIVKLMIFLSTLCGFFFLLICLLLPGKISILPICIFVTCFFVGFIYPLYMARTIKAFSHIAGISSGILISSVLLTVSAGSLILSFVVIKSIFYFVLVYFLLSLLILMAWFFDNRIRYK